MLRKDKLRKAVRDAILGGAIGDALGAPHELKHKVPLSLNTQVDLNIKLELMSCINSRKYFL